MRSPFLLYGVNPYKESGMYGNMPDNCVPCFISRISSLHHFPRRAPRCRRRTPCVRFAHYGPRKRGLGAPTRPGAHSGVLFQGDASPYALAFAPLGNGYPHPLTPEMSVSFTPEGRDGARPSEGVEPACASEGAALSAPLFDVRTGPEQPQGEAGGVFG